jgi:hypothetical protein
MMAFPARPSIKNAGFAYEGLLGRKAKMKVASGAKLNGADAFAQSAPIVFIGTLAERGPCSPREANG